MSPYARSDQTRDRRWWALLVLGAALLLNASLFRIGWDTNLLGYHEFRQVQTALSAEYYLSHAPSLHYETPLLGPPWEIPLELPLYQISAALCARASGLDLDSAGRLTSWIYFLCGLPAAYLLLRRFDLTPERRLLLLSLLCVSPLYVYYSRLFLMESTAWTASLWFLLAFSRFVEDRKNAWLPVAILAGAIAGTVKITTFAIFLVAAGLIQWQVLSRNPRQRLVPTLRALACTLPGIGASLAWSSHAGQLRAQNPDAAFLAMGNLTAWTFGDLSLRLSWTFWSKTFRVWADDLVSEAGILLLVLYPVWLRGRHRHAILGCLLVFLSAQLIFANLYWVHDYYFFANGIFLLAAVGLVLDELLDLPTLPRLGRHSVFVAVLVLIAASYGRTYLLAQRTETPVPQLARLINDISDPDDIIVVLGADWDGALPYYAKRRALMLYNGRERDPQGIRRSIQRLSPGRVAAVVVAGRLWRDASFLNVAMPDLHLGDTPLYFNDHDLGIWVPVERQPLLREQFYPKRYNEFRMSPHLSVPGEGLALSPRQIARRPEFDIFSPKPTLARASHDFASALEQNQRILIAHSYTEIRLPVTHARHHLHTSFGLADNSYRDGNKTDGIDFQVSYCDGAGRETVLYTRYLNPMQTPADRSLQRLDLPLPTGLNGEIILRVLPGPNKDYSYDWAYIGETTLN